MKHKIESRNGKNGSSTQAGMEKNGSPTQAGMKLNELNQLRATKDSWL